MTLASERKKQKTTPRPPAPVEGTPPQASRDAGAARPLRLEWIEAGSLADNPQNWRRHGEEQMAGLRQMLDDPEVGWAGACLFNERTGRLIDGHGRKRVVDPKTPVPVLIGNWSEAAEQKILLTLDPIASMAAADSQALRALLDQVELGGGAMQPLEELLESLAGPSDAGGELTQIEIKAPPRTTWVLIGIPTVRFGEIAEHVERIAGVTGTIIETTANDSDAAQE